MLGRKTLRKAVMPTDLEHFKYLTEMTEAAGFTDEMLDKILVDHPLVALRVIARHFDKE